MTWGDPWGASDGKWRREKDYHWQIKKVDSKEDKKLRKHVVSQHPRTEWSMVLKDVTEKATGKLVLWSTNARNYAAFPALSLCFQYAGCRCCTALDRNKAHLAERYIQHQVHFSFLVWHTMIFQTAIACWGEVDEALIKLLWSYSSSQRQEFFLKKGGLALGYEVAAKFQDFDAWFHYASF